MVDICVEIAGISLQYRVRYPEVRSLIIENFPETDKAPAADIFASEADLEAMNKEYPNEDVRSNEYSLLPMNTSNSIMEHDRIMLHGVAFIWQGRAWIITAPSGTGKTTQFYRWREVYGDEIIMLNGDKPILEFTADGIIVHNSPWQGKEVLGNMLTAPLAGIVYLKQAQNNTIERLESADAALPIFSQMIFHPDSRQSIKKAAAFTQRVLDSVPVFLLSNLGDRDSAILTHDTLLREVLG